MALRTIADARSRYSANGDTISQKRCFLRCLAISCMDAVRCIDIPIFANRKTCGRYTTRGIIPHRYMYSSYCAADMVVSNFKIGGTPVDTANIPWHCNRGYCQCRLGVSHYRGEHWQSSKNRSLIPHQSHFGLSGFRSQQPLRNLHSDRIFYEYCKDTVPCLPLSYLRYYSFASIFPVGIYSKCCQPLLRGFPHPSLYLPLNVSSACFFSGQRRSGPVYFSTCSITSPQWSLQPLSSK